MNQGPATPLVESQQLLTTQPENCTLYPTPNRVSTIPTIKESMRQIPRKSIAAPITPSIGRIWRPGIFRNVPWMGLSSLLVALVSTTASVIVLATSHEAAVASWSVSPHVILAILSVVITSCLNVSLSSGITITWWHDVLNTASLADTHRTWEFGNSLWAAATAGKHFNFISLATLLVALAMIQSPLIQNASTVSTRQNYMPISILASLAQNLPSGYTATATGESQLPITPSTKFSEAFNDYSTRASIGENFQGCPGTCEAVVPGVGFKVDCQSYNTSFSMENYGSNQDDSNAQFMTNTSWSADCYGGCDESLILNAGWAVNTAPSAFVNRVCNLSLAIVSYTLSFTNGMASFSLLYGTDPFVLSNLPNAITGGNSAYKISTLGGFYLLGGISMSPFSRAEGPFYANVSIGTNGANSRYTPYGLNPFSWSHAVNQNWDMMQYNGSTWRDPIPDILAAYHEIMFRLAMKAATNATFNTPFILNGINYTSVMNASAFYIFDENYYVSSFMNLVGAVSLLL